MNTYEMLTKTTGLGQVGNERERGLYLPTGAGSCARKRRGAGWCASGTVSFVGIPAPIGETRGQRRQRSERETDGWMRLVMHLGTFPAGITVVPIRDRGADRFPFFQVCQATQTSFLVRVGENRRIEQEEEP
ncbi:MAG: hypothetical protein ABI234_14365 [Ktedonobacteraceae bacterium]